MPSKLYSTTTWCSCKKETFFKAWNCIGVMQIPSHLSVSEVWLRWISSSSSMFVRLRNPTLLKIKKSSVFVCVKIKTIYTICMRQGYICDRVRNRKNHFETFLTLKEELQDKSGKFKWKQKQNTCHLLGSVTFLWIFPLLIFLVQLVGRQEIPIITAKYLLIYKK